LYADRRLHCQELLPLFKQLLKDMRKCGIETVDFSGGDLFCRKDAFDLIQTVFLNQMYPVIPTKYPLSKSQVEKLAEMDLSTIQISIDALNPEIIDHLVATKPGYGKKILKTISYLGDAGIRVRTNTVLTPYNIRYAVRLARHLAEMPHVFKSNFTCYGRSLYKHGDDMFCSIEDVGIFKQELGEIRGEFPNKLIN
jgi:MoaA/NifB/PqqE/SkfB family radical SAM enzyme